MSYNIIAVAAHATVAHLDNLFHLAHCYVCGYTMHMIKGVVKLPLNHIYIYYIIESVDSIYVGIARTCNIC